MTERNVHELLFALNGIYDSDAEMDYENDMDESLPFNPELWEPIDPSADVEIRFNLARDLVWSAHTGKGEIRAFRENILRATHKTRLEQVTEADLFNLIFGNGSPLDHLARALDEH